MNINIRKNSFIVKTDKTKNEFKIGDKINVNLKVYDTLSGILNKITDTNFILVTNNSESVISYDFIKDIKIA